MQPYARAATQVVDAVSQAVVATNFRGGTPWTHPTQVWRWQRFGGLSVYLPIGQDEARRSHYDDRNLVWARDTLWDEFLSAFWNDAELENPAICGQTAGGCPGMAPRPFVANINVYLPMVQR